MLGFGWAEGCHHLSYGLVTLPHGMGKLKSREGRAVDADELLDELAALARRKAIDGGYVSEDRVDLDALGDMIGQGALKLYLLQVGAEKNIQFDPDSTLEFEGDTGPAVQYSHARICSITRRALEEGLIEPADLVRRASRQPFADLGTGAPVAAGAPASATAATDTAAAEPAGVSIGTRHRPQQGDHELDVAIRSAVGLRDERIAAHLLTAPEEQALSFELARFPHVLLTAAEQLSPAPLASYLLDLTKAFARFYHNCPVLRAESGELRRTRLHLSLAVAATLRRGLSYLGVQAPDAM
jgi:arginyl-tRNA synthetase